MVAWYDRATQESLRHSSFVSRHDVGVTQPCQERLELRIKSPKNSKVLQSGSSDVSEDPCGCAAHLISLSHPFIVMDSYWL